MADEKSHLSWSFLLALCLSGLVLVYTKFDLELSILVGALVMIGSLIPNIDSTDDGFTGELSGLIGALAPILFIQSFPFLAEGGSVRIALTILGGFILARMLFSYLTRNVFSPRGALHSIPAILLFFEVGYLMFPGIFWKFRMMLGIALASGVASHIFLDAFTNISLVKKTMAKHAHSGSVLKFSGHTAFATWFMYLSILLLGWFVAKDIAPSLQVQAPVKVQDK